MRLGRRWFRRRGGGGTKFKVIFHLPTSCPEPGACPRTAHRILTVARFTAFWREKSSIPLPFLPPTTSSPEYPGRTPRGEWVCHPDIYERSLSCNVPPRPTRNAHTHSYTWKYFYCPHTRKCMISLNAAYKFANKTRREIYSLGTSRKYFPLPFQEQRICCEHPNDFLSLDYVIVTTS